MLKMLLQISDVMLCALTSHVIKMAGIAAPGNKDNDVVNRAALIWPK